MASGTVTNKLFTSHLVKAAQRRSKPRPGDEVALRIDQTLTQDATGTLVMLALEALGIDRVKTEVSAQYVDHNILQEDHKNPDDHLFLRSAARRFGVLIAGAGAGVSHPLHMAKLGVPGKTLLGADSHTCAAGALGMLAFGAGGIEVAMAMAGEPYHLRFPEVWGVTLEGELPPWVSAKDVILEMLRRHGTAGAKNRVLEYCGPGLAGLTAEDRHVIANMGAELGATTTVFPADDAVRAFLRRHDREGDFVEVKADRTACYDHEEHIDLSSLEPLIAKPSSPGNVCKVSEVEEEPLYQAYLGSSANPGYRDFAVAAYMLTGQKVPDGVSFDVNPTSRELLYNLAADGHLSQLLLAGARLHQPGCNGCIGMGQAPASGRNSLRTVPRNFPGRSGTREDSVWLVSPETAAASALRGAITDPRTVAEELDLAPFELGEPETWRNAADLYEHPSSAGRPLPLEKGPNISTLPELEPLPEHLDVPVILTVGDDVSTDEILPAGARVLPYRSNLEKIASFCFADVDPAYTDRAHDALDEDGGHALVAGSNYGQGSSREHAALGPRSLGLRLVLAESIARIHWQNLIAFGVLPLTVAKADHVALAGACRLCIPDVRWQLQQGPTVEVQIDDEDIITARHDLSPRQIEILGAGGLINWYRQRRPRERRRAA